MSDRTHQKASILEFMQARQHTSIDPWTCAKTFGWLKLSTIIGELRRDGHYIEDAWRKTKHSRYKVYYLVRAKRKAA